MKELKRYRLLHKNTRQPAAGSDVYSHTKGEARAMFKDDKQKRLPVSVEVVEVKNGTAN